MNKIKILDSQNRELDAEVIMTFGNKNHYIIYKLENDYYIARYFKINGAYQLDNDYISSDILKYGEEMINRYVNEVSYD